MYFHRSITGLQIASNQEEDVRFLTLTTDPNNRRTNRKGKIRSPKDSFDGLRQRIERATFAKDGFQGFKMKYICFRTTEGYGVLHIIFRGGGFVPYKWLSDTWKEIHGAWSVSIEYVHKKKKNVRALTGYLLDRYLINQPIERMSYGWGWAWLGFCKSWKHVKEVYNLMRCGQYKYENGKIVDDQNHLDRVYNKVVRFAPFKMRYKHKAVGAWKCTLKGPPKTSRQIKFFYPMRGFNKKFFDFLPGG